MRFIVMYFKFIFYFPIMLIVSIYGFIKLYKMYKKGELDINNRIDIISNYSIIFLESKKYATHISWIFWILLALIMIKQKNYASIKPYDTNIQSFR